MSDPQTDVQHDIALFRYGVIAEFVPWPKERKGLYEAIQAKAEREHTIPGSARTWWPPRPSAIGSGLSARRLRRTPAQTARRSRPGAPAAARRGRGAARRQGGQPAAVGAVGDPRGAPTPRGPARPAVAALDRASVACPSRPDGRGQDGESDAGPAPVCFRAGRGAVDERRHARSGRGGRGARQTQDLPDRLHRRCDPRDPVRALCPLGEHPDLSAGARAGDPAPWLAAEALCGLCGMPHNPHASLCIPDSSRQSRGGEPWRALDAARGGPWG